MTRARWQELPGSSDQAGRPALAELVGDLVRPYGIAPRPDADGGRSYGEMLAALIGGLVPADEPADMLILGFAMPDVWPERATATFLSHACPGSPLAFAVCDQGCAAGFTALRLARDYAAGGGCGRVLVALAEQAWLGYDPPAPGARPSGHAAFAMLCEARTAPADGESAAGGAPSLASVRVLPEVAADQVPTALCQALAGLPAGELVLGQGLAQLAGDQGADWRPVPLPPGQPLTGVWREVASWLAGPGRGGLTLTVADYDPGLRYLCVASFARA